MEQMAVFRAKKLYLAQTYFIYDRNGTILYISDNVGGGKAAGFL